MKQSNILLTFSANSGAVEFAAFNPITGVTVHGRDLRATGFTVNNLADNDIEVSCKELRKFVSVHEARGFQVIKDQLSSAAIIEALGL